jgi:hypothetical protein
MENAADRAAREIAPILKKHGFKKKHRSWFRDNGEIIQVVNLQASQWSTEDFYFNLAMYLKLLGDLKTPPEYRCHIRRRVDGADPMSMLNLALGWLAERDTLLKLRQKRGNGDLQAIVTGAANDYFDQWR